MKKYLLILFMASFQAIAVNFAELADIAGFIYDPTQDIYITKIDALQRSVGYTELFDFLAPAGGIVLDIEPVYFKCEGKKYLVELWKGQYFLSSGAEIAFYEWNGLYWKAIKKEDMPFVSYTLERDDEELFKREGIHWWFAGFSPGVFSKPKELVMDDISITFKSVKMRDAFVDALYDLGYEEDDDDVEAPAGQKTVTFTYSEPKTEQDNSSPIQKYILKINKLAAEKFTAIKHKIGLNDNSPHTIDKIILFPIETISLR